MRRGAVIAVLLALIPIASIAIDAARAAGAGEKWTISTTPNPRGAVLAELNGVTCTSTSHCIGVGDSFSPDVDRVLIQQWDGHRWTLMAGRNQPGSLNILYDVACVGPTNCFAVGFSYARHGTNKALIEHWDGEHWALMPTPKVFGSTGTSLSGVACLLVNSCFAVGSFAAHGHGIALIEHWDGTRWTVFPSRTPYDTFAALTDVSCGSADRCVAVGTIDFKRPHATARGAIQRPDLADDEQRETAAARRVCSVCPARPQPTVSPSVISRAARSPRR